MPLVLNGATSGATTLQAADATTQTITLPANSGTVVTTASSGGVSQAMIASGVVGTGPAFQASGNYNITVANATSTAATGYTSVPYDTASCFNATNGRFTPNVAGYYVFNGWYDCGAYGTTGGSSVGPSIGKNGTAAQGAGIGGGGTAFTAIEVSYLMYMNGTTDYAQVFLYQNTGGTVNNVRAVFQGYLVRAA